MRYPRLFVTLKEGKLFNLTTHKKMIFTVPMPPLSYTVFSPGELKIPEAFPSGLHQLNVVSRAGPAACPARTGENVVSRAGIRMNRRGVFSSRRSRLFGMCSAYNYHFASFMVVGCHTNPDELWGLLLFPWASAGGKNSQKNFM